MTDDHGHLTFQWLIDYNPSVTLRARLAIKVQAPYRTIEAGTDVRVKHEPAPTAGRAKTKRPHR